MTSEACHARELLIAVPPEQSDIYALHQAVWRHVDQAMAVDGAPTILYRREHGCLVRVRVSGCALRYGAAVRLTNEPRPRRLAVTLALWRDLRPQRISSEERVHELLAGAGCRVRGLTASFSVARGRKNGVGEIVLPIAEVTAADVEVIDAPAFAAAWQNGIGRGRRFGFGMPVVC